jgi:hypothetical protein
MWRSAQATRRRTRCTAHDRENYSRQLPDQRKNTRKRATRNAGSSPTRAHLQGNGKQWAESVTSRLRLIEVTITPKSEEPEKKEARVVLETAVEEGAIISVGVSPTTYIKVDQTVFRRSSALENEGIVKVVGEREKMMMRKMDGA